MKNMPDYEIPSGYLIRTFQPGDEMSWAKTLNLSEFTSWNVKMLLKYLEDTERRGGSRIVEYDREIVSGTFASRPFNRGIKTPWALTNDPINEGVIDYVATRPDHQGNGLGRAIVLGVTKFLVENGCRFVSLSTDEWRLPAIHIYLSIGFKPVMECICEVSSHKKLMPARWEAIFNKLKKVGRVHD